MYRLDEESVNTPSFLKMFVGSWYAHSIMDSYFAQLLKEFSG
jgi:hypothetical protein